MTENFNCSCFICFQCVRVIISGLGFILKGNRLISGLIVFIFGCFTSIFMAQFVRPPLLWFQRCYWSSSVVPMTVGLSDWSSSCSHQWIVGGVEAKVYYSSGTVQGKRFSRNEGAFSRMSRNMSVVFLTQCDQRPVAGALLTPTPSVSDKLVKWREKLAKCVEKVVDCLRQLFPADSNAKIVYWCVLSLHSERKYYFY